MSQDEGLDPWPLDKSLISPRISSARHAVHLGVSLTGFGKRPDLTPSHQLVFPMGITLSTCSKRTNPVSGMSDISKPRFFSTTDCTTAGPELSRRIALGGLGGFGDGSSRQVSGLGCFRWVLGLEENSLRGGRECVVVPAEFGGAEDWPAAASRPLPSVAEKSWRFQPGVRQEVKNIRKEKSAGRAKQRV